MDRLEGLLPHALAEPLRIRGDISTALERLGLSSADGIVLVCFDDLDRDGDFKALRAVINWVEALRPESPVRVIGSLESEKFRRFSNLNADLISSPAIDTVELLPLEYAELLALGRLLPIPESDDEGVTLALRGEAARRLSEAPGSRARLPALAGALLSSLSPGAIGGFSAATIYRHIYRQVVLEAFPDGRPRFPHRGRVVKTVAEIACRRGRLDLRLDDQELNAANLVDRNTGERSAEFLGLLEADVLVERCEEFDSFISFADQQLMEFVAAVALLERPFTESLLLLSANAEVFAPANGVAAHLIVMTARVQDATSVLSAVAGRPPTEQVRLVVDTALIDSDTFRQLAPELARRSPGILQEVVRQLVAAREPRLAADAAEILIDYGPQDLVANEDLAYLHASALFDVDDYEAAAHRLLPGDYSPRALLLQADIAVARGEFGRAQEAYEELLRRENCATSERGNALRGLGYVFGRMGKLSEADIVLAESVANLRPNGDSLELAEALGDYGDVLFRLGRLAEARALFEEDMAICRRLGRPACQGIAEGLLAEVDWRQGDLQTAEHRLRMALNVVRGVSYRWREAWLLRRLAELCGEQGRNEEAAELRAEADRVFAAIGSATQ
jgi:tetratricopeptide (TPR) repeat protein